MKRVGPQRQISEAERRWNLEQRQRLEQALRRLYVKAGTYEKCALVLGVHHNTVRKVLGRHSGISIDLADKLAAHLGTTADAIAKGVWKGEAA
jgi:sugar diacid utilization regulator